VQLGRGCTTHSPLSGSHVSHDGHVTCVPLEHVPPVQTAPVVQASGAQFVPSSFFTSGGHASFTPSQSSATSQAPFAGRHSSMRFASAGQDLDVPSHASAMSHSPADGRHGVPAVAATSGGQSGEVPVQLSAASHCPLAVRHTVPALPAGCVQVPVALQTSEVHTLLSLVHGLPGAWKVHVGEQQSPPSHCSLPFTT